MDEAVKLHVDSLGNSGPSREFFIKLDPDFMIDMAKLYLQYTPSDPPQEGDAADPELGKVGVAKGLSSRPKDCEFQTPTFSLFFFSSPPLSTSTTGL